MILSPKSMLPKSSGKLKVCSMSVSSFKSPG